MASKSQLLTWVNEALDLQLERLDQLANGAVACQLLDAYAGNVALHKVSFAATTDYDTLTNWKVFQAGLTSAGITKELDVGRLQRGSPAEVLDLLQFLAKAFMRKPLLDGYNPRQRRAEACQHSTAAAAGVRHTDVNYVATPKACESGSFDVFGNTPSSMSARTRGTYVPTGSGRVDVSHVTSKWKDGLAPAASTPPDLDSRRRYVVVPTVSDSSGTAGTPRVWSQHMEDEDGGWEEGGVSQGEVSSRYRDGGEDKQPQLQLQQQHEQVPGYSAANGGTPVQSPAKSSGRLPKQVLSLGSGSHQRHSPVPSSTEGTATAPGLTGVASGSQAGLSTHALNLQQAADSVTAHPAGDGRQGAWASTQQQQQVVRVSTSGKVGSKAAPSSRPMAPSSTGASRPGSRIPSAIPSPVGGSPRVSSSGQQTGANKASAAPALASKAPAARVSSEMSADTSTQRKPGAILSDSSGSHKPAATAHVDRVPGMAGRVSGSGTVTTTAGATLQKRGSSRLSFSGSAIKGADATATVATQPTFAAKSGSLRAAVSQPGARVVKATPAQQADEFVSLQQGGSENTSTLPGAEVPQEAAQQQACCEYEPIEEPANSHDALRHSADSISSDASSDPDLPGLSEQTHEHSSNAHLNTGNATSAGAQAPSEVPPHSSMAQPGTEGSFEAQDCVEGLHGSVQEEDQVQDEEVYSEDSYTDEEQDDMSTTALPDGSPESASSNTQARLPASPDTVPGQEGSPVSRTNIVSSSSGGTDATSPLARAADGMDAGQAARPLQSHGAPAHEQLSSPAPSHHSQHALSSDAEQSSSVAQAPGVCSTAAPSAFTAASASHAPDIPSHTPKAASKLPDTVSAEPDNRLRPAAAAGTSPGAAHKSKAAHASADSGPAAALSAPIPAETAPPHLEGLLSTLPPTSTSLAPALSEPSPAVAAGTSQVAEPVAPAPVSSSRAIMTHPAAPQPGTGAASPQVSKAHLLRQDAGQEPPGPMPTEDTTPAHDLTMPHSQSRAPGSLGGATSPSTSSPPVASQPSPPVLSPSTPPFILLPPDATALMGLGGNTSAGFQLAAGSLQAMSAALDTATHSLAVVARTCTGLSNLLLDQESLLQGVGGSPQVSQHSLQGPGVTLPGTQGSTGVGSLGRGKLASMTDAVATLLRHTRLLIADVTMHCAGPMRASTRSMGGGRGSPSVGGGSPGDDALSPPDGGATDVSKAGEERALARRARALGRELERCESLFTSLSARLQRALLAQQGSVDGMAGLRRSTAGADSPATPVPTGARMGAVRSSTEILALKSGSPSPAGAPGSAEQASKQGDQVRPGSPSELGMVQLDAALRAVGLAQFTLVQGIHREISRLTSLLLDGSLGAPHASKQPATQPIETRGSASPADHGTAVQPPNAPAQAAPGAQDPTERDSTTTRATREGSTQPESSQGGSKQTGTRSQPAATAGTQPPTQHVTPATTLKPKGSTESSNSNSKGTAGAPASSSRSFKLGDYQLKQLRNGDVYKGRYVGSRKEGDGVYVFVNGDVYEGEFRNDRMDGHGVYTFSHEGRYEGSWRNAVYSGAGSETFAKGSTYHGEYSGGLRNGWGICRFYSGDYYEGHWSQGLRDGRGMQQCTDESHYVGDYVKGKRHGYGVYCFPNGDKYAGAYADDLPHGYGVYTFAAGQRYEGAWASGRKNGWSLYTVEPGVEWVALWAGSKPSWVQPLAAAQEAAEACASGDGKLRGRASSAGGAPHGQTPSEVLEAALTAQAAAQEAARIAATRVTDHWEPNGPLVQGPLRAAVAAAERAATTAQAARSRALELAMRLDLAVSLMKEGSLVSPGTGAAAVLQ